MTKLHSGSWNMTGLSFSQGKRLKKWSYLHIILSNQSRNIPCESLKSLIDNFHRNLRRTGINAENPFPGSPLQLHSQHDTRLEESLKERKGLDILFILLPNETTTLYKRIKKFAERELGLQTVCCWASKLTRTTGQQQYMANIALQFNLKLGGVNHVMEKKALE